MNKDIADARALLKQIQGAEMQRTWDSFFYKCTDGTTVELEQADAARDLLAINPLGAGRNPKYEWLLIGMLIADGYHEHRITNPKKLRGWVADEYQKRTGQSIDEMQGTLRAQVNEYLKKKEEQDAAD